jgi:protein-S-isoprenylcysteine O-methyltransferase Ste14
MNRALLVRAVALYVPLAVTIALWLWRRPNRPGRAAALLAGAWNLFALLALHVLALRLGWWRFDAEGGRLLGLPVDLYLGWALLWGPTAALAFPAMKLVGVLAIGAALDVVLMPALQPVVVLGRSWLIGELAGLLLALAPAQLLARWTSWGTRLRARLALQVILFAGLVLGVLPAVALQMTDSSLSSLLSRPGWLLSLSLQLIVVAAIPGLSAVQEFGERGLGTPLPYDPPRRLVTSGIYAYVANPMQVSMVLIVLALAVALENLWIAGGAVIAFAYGAGFATWHEEAETAARFGKPWTVYRSHVRPWWPRWRPWMEGSSRLYVAEGCGACSDLGRWLRRRRPIALEILAAEDHPSRDLDRMTYEAADGTREEGVAAFARAVEHLHVGWAVAGWTARLPLVRPVLKAVLDGIGAGPRTVLRRGCENRLRAGGALR